MLSVLTTNKTTKEDKEILGGDGCLYFDSGNGIIGVCIFLSSFSYTYIKCV